MRRLNAIELNHVAEDVFSIQSAPFQGIPGEPVGFKTVGTSLGSDALFTEEYFDRVELLCEDVAPGWLQNASCDGSSDALGCAGEILEPIARRLYRRPLDSALRDQLAGVAERVAGTDGLGFVDGLVAGCMAIWTSPHFLFTDVDDSVPQTRPATSYELSERLALALWSSVPDEELMRAAEADELTSDDGLEAQVDRMLADPRAARFMIHFADQWLALDSIGPDRVDVVELGLTEANWPQLVEDMKAESRQYVRHVFDSGLDVGSLITGRFSLLTPELADYYGIPRSGQPGVSLHEFDDAVVRQGLLTHGSLLLQGASGTHPEIVKRGATVLNRFLCRPPPTPPDAVNDQVQLQLASDLSERERMEERMSLKGCANCHLELDPLGYSFHTFDAAGRYRTEDSHGELIDPAVVYQEREFSDARAVLDYLTEEGIEACVAQNLLTYTVGREFDIYNRKGDRCIVDAVVERAEDDSLAALVRAALTGPVFRSRSVAE